MSLRACVSPGCERVLHAFACPRADLVLHRLQAALRACVPPAPVCTSATLPGWGQPRAPVQTPA
eukprot:2332956-Alexandrium_andersonii.AAC.1